MDITHIVMYIVLFLALYFEVFLLITFFERSAPKKRFSYVEDASLPTVAVIVPCFNEETTVAATLRSLLALTYPTEKFNIVVVNDGSTDGTKDVLETFSGHAQIQILHKENGGKHTAMNTALAHTQAEIIGCLDADSFVETDALIQIIRHFEDSEVAAVTPSIKVYEARGLIQTLQKAEYGLAIFVRNVFARMDALFITPGPFSFFRHSVISEVGPWQHGHSTEDLEMCLRLQQLHKKITNEPNAIVYTKTPKTLHQLFRQRLRWTYGFLRNAVDYQKLFLNPKYGTLGMLVLPMSLISLFSAVFLFSSLIWNTLVFVAREFTRFKTVGISAPAVQFDVFFINTSSIITITIALVVLTLILMSLGKRLARDSYLSFDMPIYLLLYGFITPLWLTAALYKAIANTGVRWR